MVYEKNINLKMVGKIHQHSPQYKENENKAIWWAKKAFQQCEKPYLALSGGKDSVALLAIVDKAAKQLNRDYILWSHISDASFPGTIETIKEAAKNANRELCIWQPNFSAFDVVGKQSKVKFGKKGYFFSSIADFAKDYDLVFTGTRAKESKRRNEAFKFNGHIFKTKTPSDIIRCDAIAHFSIEDVAACILKYNMPIHPIYEKRALSNMPLRLGYITSIDLMDRDTVMFIKTNYPKEFLKLQNAYPEVRRYL
jgi:3'-phosphoadenosine 5'-phosphosulfate sulfotransferase (PAPS reductase)/FAD synthetase